MNRYRTTSRNLAIALLLVFILPASRAQSTFWTQPVEVTYNELPCISYRARLSGQYLAVEAKLEPGWHTFSMDNARRAAEKLAGRKSLSQDQPTEIVLSGGLSVDGSWYQTPPKDFSKPELRWYSWGFEERALFVSKVKREGRVPVRLTVRGQACTESICRKIDVSIALPMPSKGQSGEPSEIDTKGLVLVQ